MIQLKNISKIYTTREMETDVLRDVNLHVEQGDFLSVMGPSGSGKTTLLNIIGMLDDFSSGNYWFGGEDVGKMNLKKRKKFVKGQIGFVFQSFNLLDELTVYENIEMPLIYQRIKGRERKQKVEKVIEQMQISHRKNYFPRELSGGQQQRTAIARALVNDPRLILADEPTGNLDSENGSEVMKLMQDLNQSGITIIMVTHSRSYARKCNKTIRLLDGKIISENYTQDLL